jgi:hypothetical protein
MNVASGDIPKRKRAAQRGTPVLVRLQPDQLALLDEWIEGRPDPRPSRPEAVRQHLAWSLAQCASRVDALSRSTVPHEVTGRDKL